MTGIPPRRRSQGPVHEISQGCGGHPQSAYDEGMHDLAYHRALGLAVASLCAVLAFACAADAPSSEGDDDVQVDVNDGDTGRRPVTDTGAGDSGDGDATDDASTDGGGDASGDTDDDVADTTVDAEDATADAADAADGTADTAADVPEDTGLPCPDPIDAWAGVLVEDLDGGTLDVGDAVRITVDVVTDTVSDAPLWMTIEHTNLVLDAGSTTVDGAPFTPDAPGDRWTFAFDDTRARTASWTATVDGADALVLVRASLTQRDASCEPPHSRGGAVFQIAGGESKTPTCVDMASLRSLQVAPLVSRQNTGAWRDANGIRDDLRADEFIFCPQSPTIVHAAEFCLERAVGQDVTLAGSWAADGRWEVDDFVLVEVFEDGERLADGFTTQHFAGSPGRFWCGETESFVCESDCTAALIEIDGERAIPAIADADAEGPTPREHADGDVSIAPLLPDDGRRVDVRVTALDVGVEGVLTPALYLVSDPP